MASTTRPTRTTAMADSGDIGPVSVRHMPDGRIKTRVGGVWHEEDGSVSAEQYHDWQDWLTGDSVGVGAPNWVYGVGVALIGALIWRVLS